MAEAQTTSFGHLLRSYRIRAGLSQQQLAERSALSLRGLSDLERGVRRSPYPRTVRVLAEVLDLQEAEYAAFLNASGRGQALAEQPRINDSLAPFTPPLPLTSLIGREQILEQLLGLLIGSDPPVLNRFDPDLTPLPSNTTGFDPPVKRQMPSNVKPGAAFTPDLTPLPANAPGKRAAASANSKQDRTRLLTLTGVGGVGKTRLALAVGMAAQAAYADGAVLVELAPVRDHLQVVPLIVRRLGLDDAGQLSPLARLVSYLRERQLLLILDNMEHLIEAMSDLVPLLESCPDLALLVTSRLRLGVRGELEVAVEPLALPEMTGFALTAGFDPPGVTGFDPPDVTGFAGFAHTAGFDPAPVKRQTTPGFAPPDLTRPSNGKRQTPSNVNPSATPSNAHTTEPDPAAIGEAAAVRLFLERARSQVPAFRLTGQNAGAVVEICRRLDGLPLAIELAAARMRLFTPQQLLARLDRRLQVLVGGAHDLPDRQQTMRATIAWSYQLLNWAEQALFQRLAVFADGCTVEAVQAICGPELAALEPDLLLWLEALLNHHLLRRTEAAGSVRLTMLQTVREYAWEQLIAGGSMQEICARHAVYFLALAEQKKTLGSVELVRWQSQLEVEHDNLRAAVTWCMSAPTQAPPFAALRFADALQNFWIVRGYVSEARAWIAKILEHAGEGPPALRAQVNVAAAYMSWLQGDLESAAAQGLHGLRLAQLSGDQEVCANAHNTLCAVANSKGNLAEAREHGEQALALYRACGSMHRVARLLNNLGNLGMHAGDPARALPLLEESISLSEAIENRHVLALSLANMGAVTSQLGEFSRAATMLHRALAIFKDFEDLQNSAATVCLLGCIAWKQRDLGVARLLLTEAAEIFDRLGNKEDTIVALEYLAAVLTAQGDARTAALLLGAASAGRVATGSQRLAGDQSDFETCHAATIAALDAHSFAGAWAAGQVRTLHSAVQVAVAGRAHQSAAHPPPDASRADPDA